MISFYRETDIKANSSWISNIQLRRKEHCRQSKYSLGRHNQCGSMDRAPDHELNGPGFDSHQGHIPCI